MARLRYNGLSTTLGASLTSSATAVTFGAALTHSGGTAVPTIGAGDYIPLTILDSTGRASEIVYLTAYTSGATTGTITRAQEGSTGVSHASGDKVVHGPTVEDAAGGGIIAYKKQAVGTAPYTTTSTTFVDVDATNLVVTFTAPASGAVLVRLSTLASDSSVNGYNWGIREGTTTVAQSSAVNDSSGARRNYVSMPLVITGLTPGSSHTYKWAHSHDVSGTGSMWGTTSIPAVMEVLALP